MAVTITAPQSRVVARGAVTLSWTNQYPQTAYEVMYRKADATSWSTFGKVTSSATSLTMDLSKFEDFVEYHYRVVLYSENATSGTTIYNGTDSSAGYSLLVVPAEKVGTAKVKYGDGMVEVPVYKQVTGRDSVKIAVDGPAKTYGQIALGETNSPIATDLHVGTGYGVKSALGSVPKFLPSEIGTQCNLACTVYGYRQMYQYYRSSAMYYRIEMTRYYYYTFLYIWNVDDNGGTSWGAYDVQVPTRYYTYTVYYRYIQHMYYQKYNYQYMIV